MMLQFGNMVPSSIFFDVVLFLVSSLVTSPSFHASIWRMTILFCEGLTRKPEIRNTLVWVLPNISRLGLVSDTKFGSNVSDEMLLNAAKCQGYNYYRFWGNQQEE